MSDDEAKLADWTRQLAFLEERLSPIANEPVSLEQIALKELPGDPLDEAGVRPEAEALMREVLAYYPAASPERRATLRALFARHRSLLWAAGWVLGPLEPLTPERLRQSLLMISLRDQAFDTRDDIVELDHLRAVARQAGIDLAPLLREVAELSSTDDRYGMGSTRDLLLTRAGGQ